MVWKVPTYGSGEVRSNSQSAKPRVTRDKPQDGVTAAEKSGSGRLQGGDKRSHEQLGRSERQGPGEEAKNEEK